MSPQEFERLKTGDRVLVRCVIKGYATSSQFDKDDRAATEGMIVEADHGSPDFIAIPDEIAGYATDADGDFIVGDRVKWCDTPGWFIVHIIPSLREAVILNDMASLGARRTALSRLERDPS